MAESRELFKSDYSLQDFVPSLATEEKRHTRAVFIKAWESVSDVDLPKFIGTVLNRITLEHFPGLLVNLKDFRLQEIASNREKLFLLLNTIEEKSKWFLAIKMIAEQRVHFFSVSLQDRAYLMNAIPAHQWHNLNEVMEKRANWFFDAAVTGDVNQVKRWVEEAKQDINAVQDRETALLMASHAGRVEVVNYLLKQPGIKVNHHDKTYRHALHRAASGSNYSYSQPVSSFLGVAKSLVEAKATVHQETLHEEKPVDLLRNKKTPLYAYLQQVTAKTPLQSQTLYKLSARDAKNRESNMNYMISSFESWHKANRSDKPVDKKMLLDFVTDRNYIEYYKQLVHLAEKYKVSDIPTVEEYEDARSKCAVSSYDYW